MIEQVKTSQGLESTEQSASFNKDAIYSVFSFISIVGVFRVARKGGLSERHTDLQVSGCEEL